MRFLKLLSFLSMACIALACTKTLEFEQNDIKGSVGVEVSFSTAGDASIVMPADGGNLTMTVRSSKPWTAEFISDRATWCKMTGNGDKGDTSVKISVTANEDPADRNVSIRLTSGDLTKTVVVTQKHVKTLLLSAERVDMPFTGGDFFVSVRHNVEFSLTIDKDAASWIKEVSTKAMSTTAKHFTVLENEGDAPRQGKIEFKGDGLTTVLTVYQAGSVPTLILSSKEVAVKPEGSEFNVEITSNVAVGYKIETGSEWLHELVTKSFSTNTFHFFADPNDTEDERRGEIRFTDASGAVSEAVSVVQKRQALFCNADECYNFDSNGGLLRFSLISRSKIIDDAYDFWVDGESWINVVIDNYDLSCNSQRIDVKPNKTGMAREGVYKIMCEDSTVEIKIVQSADGNGTLMSLESYTDLPRSEITAINFHASSDKTTSRHTGSGNGNFPIYSETHGTVVDIYTAGEKFHLEKAEGWFAECTSLKSADLSTWDVLSCNTLNNLFFWCTSLESVNLKGLDTRNCVALINTFANCISLKSLDINHFDTRSLMSITDMLAGNTGPIPLEELDLSGWDTSMLDETYCAFQLCTNLKKLNLSGWKFNGDIECYAMCSYIGEYNEKGCVITCPYDTAIYLISHDAGCSNHIHWNLEGGAQFYRSTDYSADGKLELLSKATKGAGIDLVLMGDGYSDRNIRDGKYRNDIMEAVDAIFDVEPFKSFRDHFNIYEITAVSENEYIYGDGKTAFGCSATTPVDYNSDAFESYLSKYFPKNERLHLTTIVIINSSAIAGSAQPYRPERNDDRADFATGFGLAFCAKDKGWKTHTLIHEIGHAFGKLDDEYIASSVAVTDNQKAFAQKMASEFGWYMNVDFTGDPAKVKWSHYISDPRYASQNIGTYEGANYEFGMWRPTESSVMNRQYGFNAPSREAIYRRINTLAYGSDWKFDIETFKLWDLSHQN